MTTGKRHVGTGKRPRKRRSALGTFVGSVVVLVLAIVGKSHFGPLDGLCNGALALEPHQSTGAYASCDADTLIYSIAVYAFWAAVVVGALSFLLFILAAHAKVDTALAQGSQQRPMSDQAPKQEQPGTTTASSLDSQSSAIVGSLEASGRTYTVALPKPGSAPRPPRKLAARPLQMRPASQPADQPPDTSSRSSST